MGGDHRLAAAKDQGVRADAEAKAANTALPISITVRYQASALTDSGTIVFCSCRCPIVSFPRWQLFPVIFPLPDPL